MRDATFDQMARDDKLSRAGALRQAMLDYMNDTSKCPSSVLGAVCDRG
jgi:hypothetical protein